MISAKITRALTCLSNNYIICPDLTCDFYDPEKRCQARCPEFYGLIAYQLGLLEGQHMKDQKLITGMLAAVREFLDGVTQSVNWTEDTRSRFKAFEGLVDKYEAAIAADAIVDGWTDADKATEQKALADMEQIFKSVGALIEHIRGGAADEVERT